jgi:hypothetical protein
VLHTGHAGGQHLQRHRLLGDVRGDGEAQRPRFLDDRLDDLQPQLRKGRLELRLSTRIHHLDRIDTALGEPADFAAGLFLRIDFRRAVSPAPRVAPADRAGGVAARGGE